MISKIERQNFFDTIKTKLEICDYGFKLNNSSQNSYDSFGYSFDQVRQMKAIKELFIRFNLWIETGKEDKGSILFPEAKKRIDYHLNSSDINKCKINLMRL